MIARSRAIHADSCGPALNHIWVTFKSLLGALTILETPLINQDCFYRVPYRWGDPPLHTVLRMFVGEEGPLTDPTTKVELILLEDKNYKWPEPCVTCVRLGCLASPNEP